MSVLIPYIDKPRPDTGLTNAKLAIWLFLASEIMLFGALFSSYIFLRIGAPDWKSFAYAKADPAAIHAAAEPHAEAPPATPVADKGVTLEHVGSPLHSSIPMATINTMVLITSSITMVMAWASLVLKQFGRFRLYMGSTILLGAVFLCISGIERQDGYSLSTTTRVIR